MAKKAKEIVKVAAPIAVAFFAPVIGGAIASSLGVSSALGKAAITAATGGVLGGGASVATGGDFRTGAIGGAVAGGVGSLVGSGLAASAPALPSWAVGGIQGAASSGAAAAATGGNVLQSAALGGLGGGLTTGFRAGAMGQAQPQLTTQGIQGAAGQPLTLQGATPLSTSINAAPSTALGSQSLLAAGATPTAGATAPTALSLSGQGGYVLPAGLNLSADIPTSQMYAGGLASRGLADTAGILGSSMTPSVRPALDLSQAVAPRGTVALNASAPSSPAFINPASFNANATIPTNYNQLTSAMTARPAPLTSLNRFTDATVTPTAINAGPPMASFIQPPQPQQQGLLGRVGSTIRERITDPGRLADAAMLAGISILTNPGYPDLPQMEGMPEWSVVDRQNIAGSIQDLLGFMSPQERELYDLQMQEMLQLAEQNQELFMERLQTARGLLGEADYFDPEYWGQRAQRDVRTTLGRQERERQRQEALRGGLTSQAARRQSELDRALAGETAYLRGAETAGQRRLSTMQAGLNAMPQEAPSTIGDYSRNLTSMFNTGYGRLADAYNAERMNVQDRVNQAQSMFDRESTLFNTQAQMAAQNARDYGAIFSPFLRSFGTT